MPVLFISKTFENHFTFCLKSSTMRMWKSSTNRKHLEYQEQEDDNMSKQQMIHELEDIRKVVDPQEQARRIFNVVYSSNIDDAIDTATGTIVRKNIILDDINNEVEHNNLASIHNLISSISDFEAEYFGMDGYGNYFTLTNDTLSIVIDDIIQAISIN